MFVICVSLSYTVFAQETVKQKEIGLVFSNLNNFGLTYKTGTERSLWRFNTVLVSGGFNESTYHNLQIIQGNFGFGVNIGKEYRKPLVENIEFRYGADLSFSLSQSKNENHQITNNIYNSLKDTRYVPGFNFVLGLNFKFNDKFVLGAELLPGISYTYRSIVEIIDSYETKRDISGFNYGLSNSSVLLSFSYRF